MTYPRLAAALAAAAAASVLAAAPAFAQAPAGAPPAAGGGHETNPQQFEARCRMVMSRADVDKDGRITRQEWDNAAKRIRGWLEAHGKTLPGEPGSAFDKIDLNHDGVITPLEINAACAALAAKRAPGVQQ